MIVLILFQLLRLIVFANVYGGLEYDSGWALGTARSLAETGSYASVVNSIVKVTPGGHVNVAGRYKVQDEAGREYFSPGSIGPGSIIPNAMMIKLFGPGFWQYRIGSLLFFIISMLLASYLLYQVGGLLPIIIIHLFLFFYPHLTIFLGYEAMGEIYGLAYMLLAVVLFILSIQAKKYRWLWFFACGVTAGLIVVTKLVGLLSLSGLVLVGGLTYWEKRLSLKEGVMIVSGWVLPPIAWELTQFLTLTLLFDFQTYQGYKNQLFGFFLKGGSGVSAQSSRDLTFMWEKLLVVREISLFNDVISFIVFIIIFLSGPFLVWRFYKETRRRNILIILWTGWLTTSLWFVILSQNGWVRHNWYALIFGVFLLSLLTTYFWQQINESPKWVNRVAALFLTGLLLVGFIGQINTINFFASNELVKRWYQQHLATNHTRIPWMIVPRSDQAEAVAVLQQLPASARVFYPENYKSAEMALLSDRIFYTFQRRELMPPAKDDVLIVGPSVISPWRKPHESAISHSDQQAFIEGIINRVRQECPRIIFENSYYMLCALD